MTQEERREYLIEYLLAEGGFSDDYELKSMSGQERKNLLRSLMNIRMPEPVSKEFLAVQDEYLKQAAAEKGVTDIADLSPVESGIYLWQGDITALKCDAIVNAANSRLLGCFRPLHNCIDNCIHTYAGVQLRALCADIMRKQGGNEPTGMAKITPAFNLPCKYVIHTVGPTVDGILKDEDREKLRSCYLSCLKLARENDLESIAFCCISTGVFGFPQREAAQIAVDTVREHIKYSPVKVIFDVFKNEDRIIYENLLG